MKAEKAAVAVGGVGDEWRCRKHPAARSGGGVCPYCLRDRLLRLCPNCARVRPCPCTCAGSPSSSSSAASGETVGRVHSLIEREHRMARSRSVAASSSAAMASVAASGVGGRRKARIWGWTPFWKSAAKEGEEDEEEKLGLARSSSVSATAVEAKTVAAKAAAAKARWGGWHFPSPMKAFRHRRSSASMPERG
ncbi:uncharacterized protein LOC100832650 [Brachypodium distachyon]|uniref:DUF740 family protein n=1 Tax=Brachypodium distachyon TaxID=15368 RepID=I1ICS8_BRADI|nr:uncharacterized protein LOC100832650 [Brachypodium distachyon]KQK00841.1 hypothetical protein BRADI_3g52180v3 [Brachypodium distachyon]|eukprot:XP_003570140.1 uncharacterized protein LOC100832650 [Brachypodium distachyon]